MVRQIDAFLAGILDNTPAVVRQNDERLVSSVQTTPPIITDSTEAPTSVDVTRVDVIISNPMEAISTSPSPVIGKLFK